MISASGFTLTADQLKAIAPAMKQKAIDLFLPYINKYAPAYKVDTPKRMASFLAQVLVESGDFNYTREIWGPTKQQAKYERDMKEPWHERLTPADRNYVSFMLGNSQPGDGRLYAGHGLIQITGRTNHQLCSNSLFGDNRLLYHPELLTTPELAIRSAFWFWDSKHINEAADTEGIKDETRLVNGGLTAYDKRLDYYNKALEILG